MLIFRPQDCRQRSTRGFTLVEVAVAGLIIGLLAAVGMPAFKHTIISARTTAVVNDLRVFAAAFQSQAQQTGAYPAEVGIGVMPAGMTGALRSTAWLRITPIGGRYNWDYNVTHARIRYRAAIGLRTKKPASVSSDRTQLLSIDRRLDDGNLATGNFFLGAGNEPVLIIER